MKIICLVFGVVIMIVLISYIAYRMAFYVSTNRYEDAYDLPKGEQYESVREKTISLIKAMENLKYEEIYITSYDGKKLYGRYYHVQDNAPLQIQLHGYHGNALRDFCGGNKLAREAGQNTLVIDQRCHGKSEGHTITFGIKERYDCLSWVQYAVDRFGDEIPIFLSGVSMGAATVLMASELELPGNVVGVIADCPYSSPKAIIQKVSKDMGLPPKIMFPFVRLGAAIFGRCDIVSASAASAVANTKIPILLIHGDDDRFVPYEMSCEIFEQCTGKKRFETFNLAGHGLSFMVDTEKYTQAVSEFIEQCLK